MIALVAAFGGSAIADQAVEISKSIKGSKIKKRSIRTFFDNQGGDREDEDDDLDVGDSLNLVDDERAAGDNLNGRIVYFRPDGGVVTAQYLAEEDSAQGNDCEFVGTALATSG